MFWVFPILLKKNPKEDKSQEIKFEHEIEQLCSINV